MSVLFAPDWREGNPYQDLLAQALRRCDLSVEFPHGYKRVLPLGRSVPHSSAGILHLHWPEAYFLPRRDGFDWWRHARFCLDLEIALRNKVLAYTAHNLLPHGRHYNRLVELNIKYVFKRAGLIFAHSSAAKSVLVSKLGAQRSRIEVIPHGDLSVVLGPPAPRADALRALGLSSAPLALMFGTVEPYKSCEEIIQWWRRNNPPINLAIVGKPVSPQYQNHIEELIGDAPNIITSFGWLSDSQLRLWLSAASVVVFNYRKILTSGAACLARSYGIPIVLPTRLDTVDLGQPTPHVRRFATVEADFGDELQAASMVAPNFDEAADWREACSWDRVARLTADAYSRVEGV